MPIHPPLSVHTRDRVLSPPSCNLGPHEGWYVKDLFSPPPVKPEGTIGLHSVHQSVCQSVRLSVRHTRFPDFSSLYFLISGWKLVQSFYMKSYRLSSTFVTIDLLFHELLPFVQICFPDFSQLCFHIPEWKFVGSFHMKSYRASSTFVTVDPLFHELLPLFKICFPEWLQISICWCRWGTCIAFAIAILSVCLLVHATNPFWRARAYVQGTFVIALVLASALVAWTNL